VTDGSLQDRLRKLPGVDRVIAGVDAVAPPALLAGAARKAVDLARSRVRSGEEPPSLEAIVEETTRLLGEFELTLLKPVINATGVVIHTNLGRVPLGKEQLDAVERVASGYSNLEYDLLAGTRGTRYSHAGELLAKVTGGEAGLVVNNNAAAVLLILSGLCEGRKVIISRGELIEIGGEFRIPDVMKLSGAELVEVGTTNRTHLGDYEKAITDRTAAILKVHPSNYQVVGFTSTVESKELARLARGRGILFVHDLGSGLIDAPGNPEWATDEPRVASALTDGADLVTFSGDKLLGGPQAGLIVGRKELVSTLSEHAVIRALRVDKMSLAALEVTLEAYLGGRAQDLPLWSMSAATTEELQTRAHAIVAGARIPAGGGHIEAAAMSSVTGGGSLPGTELPSWGVAVTSAKSSAAELERTLRTADPAVIARVEDERVLLDLRTVAPSDDQVLSDILTGVLA
jgi:L-seryl-tRNA(Ser) seleniumtransferase